MKNSLPYLRHINIVDRLKHKIFTKAYDCRLLYIIQGSGVLKTEHGDLPLTKDCLAYYPSGISYLPHGSDDIQYITINFDFTSENDCITAVQVPVAVENFEPKKELATQNDIEEGIFKSAFVVQNCAFIKNDLLQLYALHRESGKYNKALCSAILKVCLLKVLRHMESSKNSHPLVEEIKAYIESNCHEITSNSEIGKKFGYHSYYLNQLFKTHAGTTLHKYLMDAKISRSEELLSRSEKSVAEISEECGFVSADHFSRLFHAKAGLSPSAYRKQMGKV